MWLPTTVKEMKALGWDYVDIVIFSGDAYIDHPSFGAAVMERTLQAAGYRVAIVPQPNWQDDLRDFKEIRDATPFSAYLPEQWTQWSTTIQPTAAAGAMMHTPQADGMGHARTHNSILRHTPQPVPRHPDNRRRHRGVATPPVHYDYWQDRLRPSIIMDASIDADNIWHGRKTIVDIASRLDSGQHISSITDVPQTVIRMQAAQVPPPGESNIILNDWDSCLRATSAGSQPTSGTSSNRATACTAYTLWQSYGNTAVKVNPMLPPMTTQEIDASFDLPYTRLPIHATKASQFRHMK